MNKNKKCDDPSAAPVTSAATAVKGTQGGTVKGAEGGTGSSLDVEMKTPPYDARFPNQNQTRNCWQNYVDYHRCQKIKGEDYEQCDYFLRTYKSLCPNTWTNKWDEEREIGSFPGKI